MKQSKAQRIAASYMPFQLTGLEDGKADKAILLKLHRAESGGDFIHNQYQ